MGCIAYLLDFLFYFPEGLLAAVALVVELPHAGIVHQQLAGWGRREGGERGREV